MQKQRWIEIKVSFQQDLISRKKTSKCREINVELLLIIEIIGRKSSDDDDSTHFRVSDETRKKPKTIIS